MEVGLLGDNAFQFGNAVDVPDVLRYLVDEIIDFLVELHVLL